MLKVDPLLRIPCFVSRLSPPPPNSLEKANRSCQCPPDRKWRAREIPDFSKVTQSVHGKTLSRTYLLNTTNIIAWMCNVRMLQERQEFSQLNKTQLPLKWNYDLQGEDRSFNLQSFTRWTKSDSAPKSIDYMSNPHSHTIVHSNGGVGGMGQTQKMICFPFSTQHTPSASLADMLDSSSCFCPPFCIL